MPEQLTRTVVEPSSQAVSCAVGDETIILDLASGQYFALDSIGSAVWRHLRGPSNVDAVCEKLAAEYNVSEDRCRADVLTLLDELAQHGLVRWAA